MPVPFFRHLSAWFLKPSLRAPALQGTRKLSHATLPCCFSTPPVLVHPRRSCLGTPLHQSSAAPGPPHLACRRGHDIQPLLVEGLELEVADAHSPLLVSVHNHVQALVSNAAHLRKGRAAGDGSGGCCARTQGRWVLKEGRGGRGKGAERGA